MDDLRGVAGPAREIDIAVPPGTSAPEPGSGRGRWRLGTLARVAALLALLVIAFVALRSMRWGALAQALRTADPRWLALAALGNLGVVALAATRWVALLRPLSSKARWSDAFAATLVGYAVSTVVPARGGEVARIGFFRRRSGLPMAQIAGSIGLDQLMNSAGFIAGLALLPWLGGIPGWMRPEGIAALALFMAAVAIVILVRPVSPESGDTARAGSAIRWGGILARLRQGLAATRSPRAITGSLIASLAAWSLEVIVLRVSLRAVGIGLPLSATLVVLMAVNVMIAVPLMPASVGTFEVGAVVGLLGYGIGKEKALAFALLYHALQNLPVAILGFSAAAREGWTGLWTDRGA